MLVVAKHFLTKTTYQALTKTLSYKRRLAEKPKVLLTALNIIVAINIEGKTVHFALYIHSNTPFKREHEINFERKTVRFEIYNY